MYGKDINELDQSILLAQLVDNWSRRIENSKEPLSYK